MRVAAYLLLAVMPSVMFRLTIGVLMGERWRWRLHHRRPVQDDGSPTLPAGPVGRPIEVIAADLRRLARERELQYRSGSVSRVKRLSVLQAYDDVLLEACGELEVPNRLDRPDVWGVDEQHDLERLRVQDALRQAGLVLDP